MISEHCKKQTMTERVENPEGDDCEAVNPEQDHNFEGPTYHPGMPDSGTPTSPTSQGSFKRRSSQIMVDTALKVKQFMREVVSRLMLIVILLFIVGIATGWLMNEGAWHLLNKADDMGWAQPWQETRSRDLGPELNNQTYVHVYHRMHRRRDEEPDVPKFDDRWIYVFYLRGAAAMMIGYGSPFFIMLAIHGIHKMWKCVAVCYTPFVVISLAISLGNATMLVSTDAPLMSGMMEVASIGILSLIEAVLVLPLIGKYLRLHHMFKVVILPFLLMNAGLFILKFCMPLIVLKLEDFPKVAFRLIAYSAVTELFVGKARMACRLVPLSDEELYRPEDKVFAVLGLDCLFGYWGRILLMDLTNWSAIMVANFGNAALEFVARVTVVQRDKFYLGLTYLSWAKRDAYWGTNAKGMMRFRCSMIISHLFSEYLMIAAAAAFYWQSGIAKDMKSHFFNCLVQVISEFMVDVATLYWEIARHKLPVIPAWFQRQKHWGPILALFVVGFNIFAISQAGAYFCAMRKPDNPDWIMLLYCGASK